MSEKAIYDAFARLNDKRAMKKFLEPIPHSDELIATVKAKGAFRGTMYDRETKRTFFINTDGVLIGCFTVTGVTRQQVAKIEHEISSMKAWSSPEFDAAVERALHIRLSLVA